MAIRTVHVVERVKAFRSAWAELAPSQSFGGLTLAQFMAATEGVLALRDEVDTARNLLLGKRVQRKDADEAANALMELVVNSVRGTPGFGSDSALYRAMGYTATSDRQSGLTRKGGSTPPPATEPTNSQGSAA